MWGVLVRLYGTGYTLSYLWCLSISFPALLISVNINDCHTFLANCQKVMYFTAVWPMTRNIGFTYLSKGGGSFGQAKYSGSIIHGCEAASYLGKVWKKFKFGIKDLWDHICWHFRHHTANVGPAVTGPARPVSPPLLSLGQVTVDHCNQREPLLLYVSTTGGLVPTFKSTQWCHQKKSDSWE